MATSGVSRDELDLAIRSRLGASHVEIEDISGGCGQAYEVIIVSSEFTGKRTLQRHKLVNAALKDEIAAVHAFTQVYGIFSVLLLETDFFAERLHTGRVCTSQGNGMNTSLASAKLCPFKEVSCESLSIIQLQHTFNSPFN